MCKHIIKINQEIPSLFLKRNFKGCNFIWQKEFEESPKPLGFSSREATKLYSENYYTSFSFFFFFFFVLFHFFLVSNPIGTQ